VRSITQIWADLSAFVKITLEANSLLPMVMIYDLVWAGSEHKIHL
jgi:hypothetical protein